MKRKISATEAFNKRVNEYDAMRNRKKGSRSSASRATRKKRSDNWELTGSDKPLGLGNYVQRWGNDLTICRTKRESLETATHNPNPTMKLEKDMKDTIASYSGRRIRLSSLRPGDWVDICGFTPGVIYACHVVQNWPSLKRIEFRWPDGRYEAATYESITSDGVDDVTYIGKGERRGWWKHLPKFLRTRIAEYSQPSK